MAAVMVCVFSAKEASLSRRPTFQILELRQDLQVEMGISIRLVLTFKVCFVRPYQVSLFKICFVRPFKSVSGPVSGVALPWMTGARKVGTV
ncbi:hypothetical protein ACET3Z_028328 [Daucus carota]